MTDRASDKNAPEESVGSTAALVWFFSALRKSWPIVVACALLTGGISLLYTRTQAPVFESAAMIEFDPDVVRPLGDKTDPMRGWSVFFDNHEYYETQYHVITSDRVLSAVVRNLGLQNDPQYLGYKPTTPPSVEDVTAMLRAQVKVEPVKNSRLVLVKVEDTNPKQARRLAEAVARAYIDQNLEKTVSATSDAVVWLSGQLDHFKNELEQSENALHDFKKTNDLPSSTLDEVSKMIRLEMQQYDSALTTTRTKKQELFARNAELAKITADNTDQIPASELLANAFLTKKRDELQQAIREKRQLLAAGEGGGPMGENHPKVRQVDEKIAQIRKDLLDEIRNIQGAVARDLAILERQEQGEASLYEAARRRAVELNLKELEFHRLDRLRAQNEKLYSVLLEQLKQADLARMMNVNNVRMVDRPTEPKAPIRPRLSLNVMVGLGMGLLFGLVLVLLREQLDNSVKTPEDVEQILRVTFLGLLPEVGDASDDRPGYGKRRRRRERRTPEQKRAPELIVHERPLSGVAEAARTLRTNLVFMNPDKPHRLLLVTSAAPSEGKTTVACSISISLAQSGQRVCIVDCDLRRPRLGRIFDRRGEAGLTNVLVGEASLDEVAQPTEIPNLWCVPSGPTPPNPADVLHSERFRQFLRDMSNRFDRVVIDSPPLVAVTDSAIVSTLVDGTVFVVRAFKTTRALAKQGLRSLRDVEAPVLGAVLNAVDLQKHQYNYYQYYYYKREGYGPVQTLPEENDESAASPPH
jgi:capsular exopolysaccharide synthesis family protein